MFQHWKCLTWDCRLCKHAYSHHKESSQINICVFWCAIVACLPAQLEQCHASTGANRPGTIEISEGWQQCLLDCLLEGVFNFEVSQTDGVLTVVQTGGVEITPFEDGR